MTSPFVKQTRLCFHRVGICLLLRPFKGRACAFFSRPGISWNAHSHVLAFFSIQFLKLSELTRFESSPSYLPTLACTPHYIQLTWSSSRRDQDHSVNVRFLKYGRMIAFCSVLTWLETVRYSFLDGNLHIKHLSTRICTFRNRGIAWLCNLL